MSEKSNYILSYQAEAIYETVIDGKQVVEILEAGESVIIDGTLKQVIAHNEAYYGASLKTTKQIVKDITGTVHATPHIFMDMVWIPLEKRNRTVIIYMALHHYMGAHICTKNETALELTSGTHIHLMMNKNMVLNRIGTASLAKNAMDLRKHLLHQPKNRKKSRIEIIKENGNVYFTMKFKGDKKR